MEPKIGDRVRVWPAPGLAVQVDGIYGRFISSDGIEVTWSDYYHRRYLDGSLGLSNPLAKPNDEAKDDK